MAPTWAQTECLIIAECGVDGEAFGDNNPPFGDKYKVTVVHALRFRAASITPATGFGTISP